MGREAECRCTWAGESADCKVLLETHDLVLRGAIRRQLPIASLNQIEVQGDALTFRTGESTVALHLGAKQARSWAKKLSAPPVTLAGKLGIVATSKVLLIGHADSEALEAALAEAATTSNGNSGRMPELVVACVHTAAELSDALARATSFAANPPIWIVYRKGARSDLPESILRTVLRGQGFIDTKVAGVDAAYTALRFTRRG
jgi:hypothetical protein